jgi:hypothetical protein
MLYCMLEFSGKSLQHHWRKLPARLSVFYPCWLITKIFFCFRWSNDDGSDVREGLMRLPQAAWNLKMEKKVESTKLSWILEFLVLVFKKDCS